MSFKSFWFGDSWDYTIPGWTREMESNRQRGARFYILMYWHRFWHGVFPFRKEYYRVRTPMQLKAEDRFPFDDWHKGQP